MSEIANTDLLLKALREIGVNVPDKTPTSSEHSYWHVYYRMFDTMIDSRDAKTQEEAALLAVLPLQPWYCRVPIEDLDQTFGIESVNRNKYLDWLKRGVR